MVSFPRIFQWLLPVSILLLLSPPCLSLYDKDDHVRTIKKGSQFRNDVLTSDSIWLVQFYAPWCGHCQNFAPTYQKLARVLNGIVSVAAIDATDDTTKRIAADYQVSGYPTLKLFGGDKSHPKNINERDPAAILKTVMEEIHRTLQSRINVQNPDSFQSASGSTEEPSNSNLVQLNASNFQESILDNPQVAMVAFIAPWCGHCQKLLPEWNDASRKLEDEEANVLMGVVDATEEESLAQEYGIQGFPTIKIFPGGIIGKASMNAVDYEGGRQAENLVRAALEEVSRSGTLREIPQLVNTSVFDHVCRSTTTSRICVLVALPHILDTGAEGRRNYQRIVEASAKAVQGMSFRFAWFEGASQPHLEDILELTFGFPALAVVSLEKNVVAVHRASFTEVNIRKFLMGITTGRQKTVELREIPEIVTVEAWDGLDGVPFEEESLEDIMGNEF